MLAIAFAYGLWRHALSADLFPRLYLYIGGALFSTISVFWLASVLYRNRSGPSTARISYDNGAIRVNLQLSRPLKVKAGQYISLWVPGVSLSSATQTHPFTVISWSEKPQKHLDLFIEPRGGFTERLSALVGHGPATRKAMLSGPHGKQLPIHLHENVVMLATGFGIAAHLPYLRKLIHDQNNRATSTRRIHLVWQIESTGEKQQKGWCMRLLTFPRRGNCRSEIAERSARRRQAGRRICRCPTQPVIDILTCLRRISASRSTSNQKI